jgi:hypothetical protein
MELIYDNNSLLPTVRSQNFFHYSDKANLEHYENFSVLLSVLKNVSIFHCLHWILKSFLIYCSFSECGARGLMSKVGKSENSADGRYGLTQTHSWRTV